MFRRASLCGLLAAGVLLAAPVHAGDDWQAMSFISGTLGNNVGRLCAGAPGTNRPSDLGCPTYAPYVSSSGNVGIGTISPQTSLTVSVNPSGIPTPAASTVVHLVGGNSSNNRLLLLDTFGTAGPNITMRAAGGTATAPTALIMTQQLGSLAFFGYGSSSYSSTKRASIEAYAADAWTDSSQSTFLNFYTTPNASTSISERMRITSNGNVGIATTNPNAKLDVNGTISATGISVTGIVSATYFEGNGSRLTGLSAAAASDRIVSGTATVLAYSNSHISTSVPLRVSSSIQIITADVETCAGGAAVGTIRINPATGAVEMCRK